jgi:hypothetical protein
MTREINPATSASDPTEPSSEETGAVEQPHLTAVAAAGTQDLPFPKTPTASAAGRTLAESKHQWRTKASHLRADAPNVLIIMLDDVGFAHADTVGGAIHTPTLSIPLLSARRLVRRC